MLLVVLYKCYVFIFTCLVVIQVGTNLVNVTVGKKNDVLLRELGGTMVQIWPSYYKDSPAVMVGDSEVWLVSVFFPVVN